MKSIYLFFFVFLIISCGSLNKLNKVKPIKRIREYTYDTDNYSILISRDSIFKSKNLTYVIYNERGRRMQNVAYNRKGVQISNTIFTRNKFDAFLTKKRYSRGELFRKSYYYYNKNKKLLKVLSFDKDSVLISDNYHKYENGKRTELTGFFYIPNEGFKQTYVYDKAGNLVEYTWNKNNNRLNKTSYTYNNKGELILEKKELQDKIIVYEYDYDIRGNKIFIGTFYSDDFHSKVHLKYDSNNNIIEKKTIQRKTGKIINLKNDYVYDNFGNWITKRKYIDGKLRSITLREVIYY